MKQIVHDCPKDSHRGGDDDIFLAFVKQGLGPLDFLVKQIDFVDLEILLALPEILVQKPVLLAEHVVAEGHNKSLFVQNALVGGVLGVDSWNEKVFFVVFV